MSTARQSFERGRSTHLAPAMRELGFTVASRTGWRKTSLAGGWLIVDIGGDRHNTRDEGAWSVIVTAWPRGTWEWHREQHPGSPHEPDASPAPLFASPRRVLGDDVGDRPDVTTFLSDMSDEQVDGRCQALLDYARAAISWTESVLRDDRSDEHTRAVEVLGAAEVTGEWTPSRLALLEALTVKAQRGSWTPSRLLLAHWRDTSGSLAVPFPQWHHPLMHRQASLTTLSSPRAAFRAGHGSKANVLLPDGTTRPPRSDDFPDDHLLLEWRTARRPLPDAPVTELPDWLPWHEWLPTDDDVARGPRWTRWLPRLG